MIVILQLDIEFELSPIGPVELVCVQNFPAPGSMELFTMSILSRTTRIDIPGLGPAASGPTPKMYGDKLSAMPERTKWVLCGPLLDHST